MKRCSRCGKIKPINSFSVDRYRKEGVKNSCKECAREMTKVWCQENKEHIANKKKARDLKTKYGLSIKDYGRMKEEQNGLCAICGSDNNGKTLHIDHNHEIGRVRKLLCNNCNLAIGLIKENQITALKIYQYLMDEVNEVLAELLAEQAVEV